MSGGEKRLVPVFGPEIGATRARARSSIALIAFGIGLPAPFSHGRQPRIILQQKTIAQP